MSPHPLQSVLHLSGPLLAHLLVSAFRGARRGVFSALFTRVHVILVTAGPPAQHESTEAPQSLYPQVQQQL